MFNARYEPERKNQNYLPQYFSSQSLTPIPKIYAKQYRPVQNNKNQQRQIGKINDNKSFLDGFDNNNSSYLIQNKSYARNIRGRLLNNEDPAIEKVKEDRIKNYRQDLARQMQQDRIRKQKKRKEQQQIQLKRQKLFYQKVKIQAQQKIPSQKQGNAYFLMRTNYKKKFEQPQNKKVDNFVEVQNERQKTKDGKPKISRRAYQNNRNYFNNSLNQQPQHLARQRVYQEQRISRILSFQQNMLKKLQYMKTQIRNTSSVLQVDKQLEKVRFRLKANPIGVDRGNQIDRVVQDNLSSANFYSLPKRKVVKPPSSRFQLRLNNLKKNQMNTTPKKQQIVYNDKNFLNIQEQSNPQLQDQTLN